MAYYAIFEPVTDIISVQLADPEPHAGPKRLACSLQIPNPETTPHTSLAGRISSRDITGCLTILGDSDQGAVSLAALQKAC